MSETTTTTVINKNIQNKPVEIFSKIWTKNTFYHAYNGWLWINSFAVVSDSESDDGVMVNIPPSDDAIEEETDAFIPQAPEVAPVNAPSVSGLPGGQGSLRRPNSAKFARPAVPPPRNKLPSSTSDVNGTESKATVRVPNATAPKGSRATTHGAGVRPSQDSARDRKSEVSPRPSLPGNSAGMSTVHVRVMCVGALFHSRSHI